MRQSSLKTILDGPRFSIGLYALLSFLAFAPCLLLNQVYIEGDLLHQYSHFRSLLRSQLASGHFPLWNPYFFGGQPFFADPNVMMCYPLNYLTLFFPVPYGLGVFFFLHMFLAALGMHFWLKTLRLSENACRAGALLFAFSGFFWWEIIHPPVLAAFAWFPWLVGSLENLCRERTPRKAFLAGLCFTLVFCCGNFQSTTCIFYSALAYFLFRLWTRKKAVPRGKNIFLTLVLFAAWGSAPLLCHLIPAEEFSRLSLRRDSSLTYDNFNGTFSMPPRATYEFLFPAMGLAPGDRLEDAIQRITDPQQGDNDFFGSLGYLGVWIPILIFAAFRQKEKKLPLFLLLGGLLSLLTSWGRNFPLHRLLCSVLPGLDFSRASFRFIETYVFFGCALAALGWETLEPRLTPKSVARERIFLFLPYALVLFVAALIRPAQTWMEMASLILGAAGLCLWRLEGPWRRGGRWIFLAALVLPLLLRGWSGYSRGPASNYDYEKKFPAFSYLREKATGCRYHFDESLSYPGEMGGVAYRCPFPEDAVMEFGIRTDGGYNPVFLSKTDELKTLPLKTYSRLMAVNGFLFGHFHGESPLFSHQILGSTHFYQPVHPARYVNAPFQLQIAPDDGSDLRAMSKKGFDPATQAVLNEALPEKVQARLSGKKASLQYEITKDDMDRQIFKIDLDADSLVTFSEVSFPGWKAWMDGRPTGLFTANHVFRALFIPAGRHQVEFRYIPVWFHPLLLFMVVWCLSVMVYGVFFFTAKRT